MKNELSEREIDKLKKLHRQSRNESARRHHSNILAKSEPDGAMWKLMKKVIKANRFIETIKEFKSEIIKFLSEFPSRFFLKRKLSFTRISK